MVSADNLRCRSTAPYRYSPIDTSELTIRLLEVLPSLTRGQLSLALKHVSLAEAKDHYHTISYTWGNDEPSHRVYIEAQYLLLRDSIWSFLMHYQKTPSILPRWLWIDSICINQSDVAEKNQQVSLMGLIFRESYGTLIWLDSLSVTGSFAVASQNYWSTTPRNINDEQRSRLLDVFLYGSTESKIWEHRKTIRHDAIELFEHNYWRRLWVVQEIILSQRISIVLGRTTISLDLLLQSLYDSIPFNQSHLSEIFDDEYLDYALQRLCTNRMGDVEDRQSFSLLSLVSEYQSHGCKDVRDRVYGLLALTNMSNQVTIDYDCHIVALFADTLQSYVAVLENFGPKRENMHMYDVRSLMRALNVRPDVLVEYQSQAKPARSFTSCFKIQMFPTVVYVVASHQSVSTFSRLIDANDTSINSNMSIYADKKEDHLHAKLVAEISSLDAFDRDARYLLCHLPLSGFETVLCVPIIGAVVLVGTVEYTGKPNTQGNLVTPCLMPLHVLDNINKELNISKDDFRRAAFEHKVEWPGYVVRCSIEELIHLQGSHDN